MASLIDTLAEVLHGENEEYQKLLDLSRGKSDVIVRGDLESLAKITEAEQAIVTTINALEVKRSTTMDEIAKILNTDVAGLKLETLIGLLDKKPKEREKLSRVHDELHTTLYTMKRVNEQNAELLSSAIEMVDFNMSMLTALKKAPETANYNKGAFSTGTLLGSGQGSFDAKQ